MQTRTTLFGLLIVALAAFGRLALAQVIERQEALEKAIAAREPEG